jgi:hypothetical protein
MKRFTALFLLAALVWGTDIIQGTSGEITVYTLIGGNPCPVPGVLPCSPGNDEQLIVVAYTPNMLVDGFRLTLNYRKADGTTVQQSQVVLPTVEPLIPRRTGIGTFNLPYNSTGLSLAVTELIPNQTQFFGEQVK